MNKQVILFDIDKTLFDNDKFVDLKDKVIISLIGIKDIQRYKNILTEYLLSLNNGRDFDPKIFINLVCKEFKYKNKKLLTNLTYNEPTLYRESLFDDVLPAFNKLVGFFTLGIYSEAKLDFQKYKLKALNITEFLNSKFIFIFEMKDTKEVLKKIPANSIIIDDKEKICDFLTDNGFKAIWLNRKDERKNDKFDTIHSLLELPKLLKVV